MLTESASAIFMFTSAIWVADSWMLWLVQQVHIFQVQIHSVGEWDPFVSWWNSLICYCRPESLHDTPLSSDKNASGHFTLLTVPADLCDMSFANWSHFPWLTWDPRYAPNPPSWYLLLMPRINNCFPMESLSEEWLHVTTTAYVPANEVLWEWFCCNPLRLASRSPEAEAELVLNIDGHVEPFPMLRQ